MTNKLILLSILAAVLVSSNVSPVASDNGRTDYPLVEVYTIVDYDTYEFHHKNDDKVKVYYQRFWKTVESYLEPLGVRIRLVDIKIAHDRKDLPYLNDYRLVSTRNTVYSPIVRQMAEDYLATAPASTVPHFDVAFIMTQYSLCSELVKSFVPCESFESFTTARQAMCSNTAYGSRRTGPVMMVRDQGKIYRGVRRAVLSIGSLLGAELDGQFETEDCPATDGHFMSPIVHYDYQLQYSWSECSKKAIKQFLPRASCLYDTSSTSMIPFNEVSWPGEVLSLDSFCYGIRLIKPIGNPLETHNALNWDESVCQQLKCRYNNSTVIEVSAVEGSWCHENKRCRKGKCVPF